MKPKYWSVIILAAVTIAASVLWWAKQPATYMGPIVVPHHQVKTPAQATTTPQAATAIQGWQTYIDSDLAISFEYPANWVINSLGQDSTSTVEIGEPKDDTGNSDIDISKTDSNISNDITNGVTVLSNQTKIVDGISWQIVITKDETSGDMAFNAITKNAAGYYIISSFDSPALSPVTDHLLSTFQFANPTPSPTPSPATQPQTDTSGWKTYANSQYGFSFEYPSNLYIYPTSQGSLFTLQDTPKQLVFGELFGAKGKEGVDFVTEGFQFNLVGLDSKSDFEKNLQESTYNITKLNLSNIQATRYDDTGGITLGPVVAIEDPNSPSQYVIFNYGAQCGDGIVDGQQCTTDQVEKLFNQILSNFKFTPTP